MIKLENGIKYSMDSILKSNIDAILHNLPKDWDMVIQVSGDNMVRVGKSVLALQVGAYAAEVLKTPWSLKNVCMTAEELVEFARVAPKNSVIIYDEAAEGLQAAKSSEQATKLLIDYFNECGQYNHFFILVSPSFFRLKQDIAVDRSEFLINVYRVGKEAIDKFGNKVIELKRGQFQLFNRKQKAYLYERFKRNRAADYSNAGCSLGRFPNTYTVDEEPYRAKKRESLARLKEKESKKNKYMPFVYNAIRYLRRVGNMKALDINDVLGSDFDSSHILKVAKTPFQSLEVSKSAWKEDLNINITEKGRGGTLEMPPIQSK